MNKIVVIAVFYSNVFYSSFCLAFGIDNTEQRARENYNQDQWPVIVNKEGEYLGLYGGISTGYNRNGEIEGAMLLITHTGYIAPILNRGGIALIPSLYFKNVGCAGNEYLPATIKLHGTSLYRGMVYRSLSSSNLGYIPKQSDSKTVKTHSRLRINSSGKAECDESEEVLEVYELMRNSTEITGIDAHNNYDLVAVVIEEDKRPSRSSAISSDLNSDRYADNSESTDIPQEECSPACLTDAVGNGSCDIECYVESCFYDKGDCDNLSPEELQMKLSTICSPGCNMDDIGDGYCDTPCDNQNCQFDGGDCKQQ